MASGSPQNIYQNMQKCILIVLMHISWSNMSENLIHDSICIIFLRNMCMVSIKENIIPNSLFESLGLFFVILSTTSILVIPAKYC